MQAKGGSWLPNAVAHMCPSPACRHSLLLKPVCLHLCMHLWPINTFGIMGCGDSFLFCFKHLALNFIVSSLVLGEIFIGEDFCLALCSLQRT